MKDNSSLLTHHSVLPPGAVPTHLGLILDGNRRWAKSRGLPTVEGHRRGYETLKTIADTAFDKGVKFVSAFVFSTENWDRSKEEVGYLMDFTVRVATKDLDNLISKDRKVVFLGSKDRVPEKVANAIKQAEEKSKNNKGGTIALCFNYGGKQEIVDAVKKFIAEGNSADDLTAEQLSSYLYHPDIPQIDLLIRTSGEQRISNFMLWRSAYSELYFTEKFWPDFDEADLDAAFSDFAQRHRRFGK